MPNDRPASKKTSWKPDNGAAARKPVRGWQQAREVGPGGTPPPRRPLKLLWAALGLLGCGGMIVALIILLSPPKPARLVLIGASYADNLAIPHNAYGLHSFNDFLALSRLEIGLLPFWRSEPIRLLHRPVKLEGPEWKDEWREEIARLAGSKDIREPTVIVFLALHGGSGRQGAYLLADADGANRLPISDVLAAMAKLPREKKKLLILDATQVADDWTLGMLHNDFARELKKLREEIRKVDNLWVLGASDEDQRSWVDVDGRRSVFSRAVVEGLRGEADARPRDGRIDLRELYDYVGPRVKAWAFENRGDVQTPLLLPAADDKALALAAEVPLSYYKIDAARPSPGRAGADTPATGSSVGWWDAYKALRDEKPGPAVYSPHLWRRFKDALIRLDQLHAARLPEPKKLENLEADLRGLESRIRAASLPLELGDSRYCTLVMAGAKGELIPRSDPDRKIFAELLSKPLEQFTAAWDEKIGARVGPDLKARFNAYLMDRLAEPGQDPTVDQAAKLLARYSNGPLRPAEVHFLLMAEAHLRKLDPASRARPDLIRRAVGIRRLAEEAALAIEPGGYSYSEELVPWIRSGVEGADEERRRGEDLLFATDAALWDEADRAFGRAERLYKRARERAAVVRQALEVRNRVLDELPDYTRWWARRSSVAEGPRPASGPIPGDGPFTESLESLWEKVHLLAELLEGPSETVDPAPLTGEVRLGFEAVEGRFLRDLRDLDRTQLPRDWTAEVALAVPFVGSDGAPPIGPGPFPDRDELPPPIRTGLGTAADDPAGSDADSVKRQIRVRARASIQGRLALAVLGERAFDGEALGKGLTPYDAVLEELKAAPEKSEWWKSIAFAGDNVADRLDRMPGAIEGRLSEGTDSKNTAPSEAPLRDADRLARQLAGAAALTKGPAEEARKRRMHDLLVWMAGRTLKDHWSGDGPKAAPYYREAGLRFAKDALALVPHSRAVAGIQEELNRPGTLEIEGPQDGDGRPAEIVWTSEQQMELSYGVRPAKEARVSPGTAVVWGEAADADLLRLEPTAGGRTILDVGRPPPGGGRPPTVRYTLRSPLLEAAEGASPRKPDRRPTSFRVRGFYRGQDLELATNVRLHPAPDSVLIDAPKPPQGSVAVRAGDDVLRRFGDNNAAVAIVLDASGSMWENMDRVKIEASKYMEATEAIREILRRMPKGTTVSLWVFGRAVGPMPQRRRPAGWETIAQVLAPVAWNPEDQAQLEEVMRRIRPPATIPYHGTPIVQTMIRAKGDLKDADGFKTLVVLTDGGESDTPTEQIPEILRKEFQNTRIMINMVCFKAKADEQKAAQKQFKDILENGLEVPGKFQLANNVPALAQDLRESIARTLTYRVHKSENVPARNAGRVPAHADHEGLPVSRSSLADPRLNTSDAWHPGLDAGHFLADVAAIPLSCRVMLKDGDRLLLRLVGATGGGVRFARDLYADEPIFRPRPRVERNGWLLAVLQNKLAGDRTLNMTVTLEKTFDRAEAVLEQLEPREVWMELEPARGDGGTVGLRWSGREEYPAAAWDLSVPDWPADAGGNPIPARLRAWWDKDRTAPAADRLERARGDFRDPLQIRDLALDRVLDDRIVIESVAIEQRRVPERPGGPVSCLVIRASHPPNKPIWIRPGGISPANAQHRFYAQAGRYAGVFWPLNEDEVRKGLDALEVVSVEAFRKRARDHGDYIEIGEAGRGGLVPDPADHGLPPPIAIER